MRIGLSTVDYYLRKNNTSVEKIFYDPGSSQKHSTLDKRNAFVEKLGLIPGEDRYFLDGTGGCLNMTRRIARSPKNEKARSERPIPQGEHLTALGIMGKEKMILRILLKVSPIRPRLLIRHVNRFYLCLN
jgi:hypothetical protein